MFNLTSEDLKEVESAEELPLVPKGTRGSVRIAGIIDSDGDMVRTDKNDQEFMMFRLDVVEPSETAHKSFVEMLYSPRAYSNDPVKLNDNRMRYKRFHAAFGIVPASGLEESDYLGRTADIIFGQKKNRDKVLENCVDRYLLD